jgi:4-hydroxy-tetrahydrodipicolinate synthase
MSTSTSTSASASAATPLRRALAGISGILVSPFDAADEPAPAQLRPIVDRAIGAGVHLLVANGNTSEFYGLLHSEAVTLVHAAAEQIAGRVPLLGGVGRGVKEACLLARESKRAGAAGLMVHQPPDPFVAPRGVVAYVERVAVAADGLPVVLYLRNELIGMSAIEALCRIPSVVGVKWASPTPLVLAEAMRRTADLDIAWVCGLAETWAPPLYAVGARGFTSGLINVAPARSVAIHAALDRGDYADAMRRIAEMETFESLRAEERNGANVSIVKAALRLMGNDCGAARAPSAWPVAEKSQAQLQALLAQWGLLR